jgi:thymidine kinase
MAKLHFYYSAMNAGKSAILLQSDHNYKERGMDTLLFTPAFDNRYGGGVIKSRIGLSAAAFPFDDRFDFSDFTTKALRKNDNIKCVLVDEAQFLTKKQVAELCDITDYLNIPVLAYGLRSDFRGEPFIGSQYLLAQADSLLEIKTICHCGRKATMNIRVNQFGEKITEGAQIEVGGNDRYVAVCRKHFKEGIGKSSDQQKCFNDF